MLLFVGSYAEASESGVELFHFDEAAGSLTKQAEYAGLKNPTFLNVNPDTKSVYAIAELVHEDGSKSGAVAHFRYTEQSLQLVNQLPTVAGTTCHIQRDQSNQYLIVTSYHGGMIGLIKLHEDGSLGETIDVVQHSGSSVDPERQDRPHPHSSFFSPDGRYLYVQDLGLDKLLVYTLDQEQGKLLAAGEVKLPAGAGPRHLAFHPSLPIAYVINELDSTVSVFRYEAATGQLAELQHISTLPEGFNGENGTAEITVSADGRFVYGSNRGHDSIVVFAVDEQGKLSVLQHISSGGGHPRHFTLTPSNRHLLVANRDNNNIVVFERDAASGKLTATGQEAFSTKPVCLIPVQ